MKILFLDIDGVLNDHAPHPNSYCGMSLEKLEHLNVVVGTTKCHIVLASAWRYLVLNGQMTLGGFGSMMLTHGASRLVAGSIVGTLAADRHPGDPDDRGHLARDWAAEYKKSLNVTHAVALDDGVNTHDLGYASVGIPCVRPVSSVGLTAYDANRVIDLFGRDKSKVPA